jgi:hypothetical protein
MPDEAACAGRIHVVGLLVEPGYVPTAAGKFVKNPASSPDSPWLASALAASDRRMARTDRRLVAINS